MDNNVSATSEKKSFADELKEMTSSVHDAAYLEKELYRIYDECLVNSASMFVKGIEWHLKDKVQKGGYTTNGSTRTVLYYFELFHEDSYYSSGKAKIDLRGCGSVSHNYDEVLNEAFHRFNETFYRAGFSKDTRKGFSIREPHWLTEWSSASQELKKTVGLFKKREKTYVINSHARQFTETAKRFLTLIHDIASQKGISLGLHYLRTANKCDFEGDWSTVAKDAGYIVIPDSFWNEMSYQFFAINPHFQPTERKKYSETISARLVAQIDF